MNNLAHTLARLCGVFTALMLCIPGAAGCRKEQQSATSPTDAQPSVTVYTSIDEQFARDLLDHFQKKTGIKVNMVGDSEAGKTTGLVTRIRAEADRPRADLFWSSELFNTILLGREGLLEPYNSPAAADIPERYRDVDHLWTALGLRARVVTFDPTIADPATLPPTWEAFADEPWCKQTAIGNPIFGTTRGHVAAMYALWGRERYEAFLTKLNKCGAMVADGNSATVRALMAGQVTYAMTDSDDVIVANNTPTRKDRPFTMIYPDMGDGGTLLIPCTVAMLKGGTNNPSAKVLFDFLVSEEAERMLAESDSQNYPVRASLRTALNMPLPPESKLSFHDIADAIEPSMEMVRNILLR